MIRSGSLVLTINSAKNSKGIDLVQSLKNNANSTSTALRYSYQGIDYSLRAIRTNINILSDQDIQNLTTWRNLHKCRFLTQFDADHERTKAWLLNTVSKDDKILLMLCKGEEPIGHLGLGFINWETGYFEADAIVRGVDDSPKGLMKYSLKSLIHWGFEDLDLKSCWVRVRSDNPAVSFYEKCGFAYRFSKRLFVCHSENVTFIEWKEDPCVPAGSPSLVYMEYLRRQ